MPQTVAIAQELSVRHGHAMETTTGVAGDWPMIEAQLPPEWRELAVACGVIKPVPPQLKPKITDPAVLLRLIFHHVALGVSLKITCAVAAAAGIVDLTAVALHLRMRSSGTWLAAMLTRMLDTGRAFHAQLWAGYEIVIADATVVTRPGAKGTTARVHYALRLSDLRLVQCHVTDETGGETIRRFSVSAGQLWLLDRAYANPPGVAAITAGEGAILVRYNYGTLPLYDAHKRPLDVWAKVQRLLKPGRVRAWAAWVHPAKGDPIRGRLCAVRIPADKVAAARARARREADGEVTEEMLHKAEFVVLFTTVPPHKMTADLVVECYRLRWGVGASCQGRINQSVKVRPGSRDSRPRSSGGTVAREQDGEALRQQSSKGGCATLQVAAQANADVASLHANPVAETVHNARRHHGPFEKESQTAVRTGGVSAATWSEG